MHIIEEMVEYFSELLTKEQASEVERLFHVRLPQEDDDRESGRSSDFEDDDDRYDEPYDPYDQDVLFPPPRNRGGGHARGKRRRWRHPVVSAGDLVEIFRRAAKSEWERFPVSLELFLALAGIGTQAGKKAGRWRNFLAAVEGLEDLDPDALGGRISLLLREERKKSGAEANLFARWLHAQSTGGFTKLADDFCKSRIDGVAGRAVLKALRGITWPETAGADGDVHVYRPFLENRELVGIFGYYRILRKLEYLLEAAAAEAVRRQMLGKRP